MSYPKTKIGILISGRGSNMVALADAIADGRVPNAEVAIVVSDHADAKGLIHAEARNLKTAVAERRGRSREEHDRETIALLKTDAVELVCLAGYMRWLSGLFLDAYRNRILNIHPSLLPAFPGLHAQRQALEAGVKWTGCTVHFVDETLDGGPIIAQRAVPILEDDTEDTLSSRILQQEHELYPEALARVLSNDYEICGQRFLRKQLTV
jgi:phosphoribosylglycinamide formyltransferase-1